MHSTGSMDRCVFDGLVVFVSFCEFVRFLYRAFVGVMGVEGWMSFNFVRNAIYL